MGELSKTLQHLSLAQHLLALLFLLGYGCALGAMFGPRGRVRSLLLAGLAAAGFAALTEPWEHGVLLALCAIIAVGVFIALAWATSAIAATMTLLRQPASTSNAPSGSPPPHPVVASAARLVGRAVKRRRAHST